MDLYNHAIPFEDVVDPRIRTIEAYRNVLTGISLGNQRILGWLDKHPGDANHIGVTSGRGINTQYRISAFQVLWTEVQGVTGTIKGIDHGGIQE